MQYALYSQTAAEKGSAINVYKTATGGLVVCTAIAEDEKSYEFHDKINLGAVTEWVTTLRYPR
jgi:hypothetical protein